MRSSHERIRELLAHNNGLLEKARSSRAGACPIDFADKKVA